MMKRLNINWLSILSAFVVGALFLLPRGVHAIDAGWESLSVLTDAGVVSVRLVRINMSDPGLQIRSLTDVSGERMNVASPIRPLQSYVDQVGGFAGINGSYFCPSDYSSCAGKEGSYYWMWYDSLKGTFVNSYQNQFNPGPVIAFDSENQLHYFKVAEDWPGKEAFEASNNTKLQALISNGPGLIYESKLTVSPSELDTKQRTIKSNRSGIGFKGDNMYLVVASSATVMDLGYAMQAMGMQYAMNLDGGGSSALYYNGQYGVGPGRNMPNAVVFVDTGEQYSPPVASGTSFFAYDTAVRGGYSVSSGNVTGDARDEILAGTETGMGPQVQVFDADGNRKAQFFAYDQNLRNGVRVTACDVNADGFEEIVTAQGKGGWPIVRIFNAYGTQVEHEFYVLDGKYTGGVNLSCGDTDGDGTSEIVVAASAGGGPHVLVYNASGKILTNFMAYDTGFRGGIRVSTIDMDGDGRDEIVTGPEVGAPHVQIFQIRPNELKRLSPGFYAFNADYRGGVSVAGVDTDGDGTKELVVGVGGNATPLVRIYNIREEMQKEFFVFETNFLGGVNVAGGDVDNDGSEELIVAPRSSGGPQVRVIEAGSM
ncbi:MAG: phosphodiester glycosidase family protein [Patescibacteria group bacterium]|nr:phosphodiester glycosidase family protein [Patescibacteria group bacterium]MDD5715755.1 phosphodiester glycosidase family protein [Patescibacteria group bacterium]